MANMSFLTAKSVRHRLLLTAPSLDAEAVEFSRAFAGHGVEVTVTRDFQTALRVMKSTRFDLVVCDLTLPGGSGLELVRAVRARDAQAPVVVLCDTQSPLLEAAELGASCVQSPLKHESLMQLVLSRIENSAKRTGRIAGDAANLAPTRSVAATAAKNQFGQLLDTAMQGGRVVIKKHDTPKAVLLSYEEYQDLTGTDSPDLAALSEEFDQMMAQMQTSSARAATDALFGASSDDLAEAALAEARGDKRSARRG